MFLYTRWLFLIVWCSWGHVSKPVARAASPQPKAVVAQEPHLRAANKATQPGTPTTISAGHHATHQASLPPSWLVIPFVVLLLMIATGPLLYERFWHQHYPKVAILLATLVLAYYLLVLGDWQRPLEACVEYIQFIVLIAALYMTASGILIVVSQQATPFTNLCLLFIGALGANLIGTTGASMLLIRPYMRLNQGRIKVYHIVFFIFIVSNIGGALTPIGDPPLFLGFLSGVPFFWTLRHNLLPWLAALLLLGGVFYWLDTRNNANNAQQIPNGPASTKPLIRLLGKHNFIGFAIIIGAVFIDPNLFDWVPAVHYGGHTFSYIRELILLGVTWVAYRYANRDAMQENAFSWGPLKEVVVLFMGIFGTMLPALQLISTFAASQAGQAIITHNTLYWGTGLCSSVLDNAPTYLNFCAASIAAHGADIATVSDVQAFAAGGIFSNSVLQLRAISVASVFFGAMTYIGNGPNFMIKAIAEQSGIRMPAFFTYMLQFSIPILLPVLVTIWLLFFAFA
ncbi:MAG: sodium:proton antiporter [Bacteroidota bacterium]